MAQKLSENLGKQFFVENIGGAGSTIGTDRAAKATPDGSTIIIVSTSYVVNSALLDKVPYDPLKAFDPITLAVTTPMVLAIHPSVPVRSVKELVALARGKPLRAGVSTIASVQHLLAEMFNNAAGLRMEIIAYKGGAQVATDVVGGQIESLWSVLPVVLPFIQGGRLRAIAIASEKRSALLPNVPTMVESGWPSVVATAWNGVVAPAGTPRSIVEQLNSAIGLSLQTADKIARFDPKTETWTEFSLPIIESDARRIELDPSNPNRIWWAGDTSTHLGYIELLN